MGGVRRARVGTGAGMVKGPELADINVRSASGTTSVASDISASTLNISKLLSSCVVEAIALERLGSLVEPDCFKNLPKLIHNPRYVQKE